MSYPGAIAHAPPPSVAAHNHFWLAQSVWRWIFWESLSVFERISSEAAKFARDVADDRFHTTILAYAKFWNS